MERDELFKLLEFEMKEEQYYLSAFQKELSFFWSIISAITGASVVGLFKVNQWEQYIYLTPAPVLLFAMTIITRSSLFRTYQRFIEAIASRAKIESLLCFDAIKLHENSSIWRGEPLLIKRHIDHRNTYESSAEFVNAVSQRGLYKVYSNLIVLIRILCIVFLLVLISLAYFEYRST